MRRESWFVPARPSRRRTPATLALTRFVMPLIAISRSKKPLIPAASRRTPGSDWLRVGVTLIVSSRKRPATEWRWETGRREECEVIVHVGNQANHYELPRGAPQEDARREVGNRP